MKAIGIRCSRGSVSFEQCKRCALKCIPSFIVDIFTQNQSQYLEEHPQFTVSQLSDCLRKAFFDFQGTFIDVNLLVSAVRGSLIHKGLSEFFKVKEGYLSEYKITKVIDDYQVTGTLDLYSKKTRTIYDFKTGSRIYLKYRVQLTLYKQLVDLPVDHLKIVLFSNQVKVVPIEEVNIDLSERVRSFASAITSKTAPLPEKNDLLYCNYCSYKKDCL